MHYVRNESAPIRELYTDSDFAEDPQDRKSTSGGIVYILYTMYMVTPMWHTEKQREMHYQLTPIFTSIDNTAAATVAEHPGTSKRTKSLDIKWHSNQDLIRAGYFYLKYKI